MLCLSAFQELVEEKVKAQKNVNNLFSKYSPNRLNK